MEKGDEKGKFIQVSVHTDTMVAPMRPVPVITKDGKIFRKGEKIRKRFRCEEVKTRKIYLFSPVYEVEQI